MGFHRKKKKEERKEKKKKWQDSVCKHTDKHHVLMLQGTSPNHWSAILDAR